MGAQPPRERARGENAARAGSTRQCTANCRARRVVERGYQAERCDEEERESRTRTRRLVAPRRPEPRPPPTGSSRTLDHHHLSTEHHGRRTPPQARALVDQQQGPPELAPTVPLARRNLDGGLVSPAPCSCWVRTVRPGARAGLGRTTARLERASSLRSEQRDDDGHSRAQQPDARAELSS